VIFPPTVFGYWSDPAKIAIHQLLAVGKGLRGSKEEVSRAYTNAATSAKNAEQNSVPDPPSIPTRDAGTQNPCWWDIGDDREPRNQAINTKRVRGRENGEPTDQQAQTSSWTEVVRNKSKYNVPAKTADNRPAVKPKIGEERDVG